MKFFIFCICLLCIFIVPVKTHADILKADPIQHISILPDIIHADDDGYYVGLDMQLNGHWKTYWRSPGIAGQAMQLDYAGSKNIAALDTLWPAPVRFKTGNGKDAVETIGYNGHVVFPLRIKIKDQQQPADLKLTIDLVACDVLCVPVTKIVTHRFKTYEANQDKSQDGNNFSLQNALQTVPQHAVKFKANDAWIEKKLDETWLVVKGVASEKPKDLLLETDPVVDGAAPDIGYKNKQLTARLKIRNLKNSDAILKKPWRLTTLFNSTAEDQIIMPQATIRSVAVSYHIILLFAFLGGLILNIMPCVLPVLALKLFSVMNKTGLEKAAIRQGFLLTALGIVASFLSLAGLVIVLKAAGQQVGWGMQFQQPAFLIFLIVIVLIFAFNLLGVFHFYLPQRLLNVFSNADHRPTKLAHVLNGAFATLLATPCTAPLLGTATGFALAGSMRDIVIIFTIMAVGFALPYYAVAAFPSLVAWLPKPGRWMAHVKKLLALSLLMTAFWLTGILYKQLMPEPNKAAGQWQAFDENQIANDVAAQKTILVDVTADWCLTCHVNDRAVLQRQKTRQLLTDHHVIPMRADWTKRDDAITHYLQKHQRAGVPFNVVYGAGAPDGIVLNEILTFSELQKAVAQAGAKDDSKP